MPTEPAVFRADVVGSLLRPPRLVEARGQMRAGTLDPEQYRQIEDESVVAALRLQEQIGLQVVTDGEMRRDMFFDFLVKGFGRDAFAMQTASTVQFHNREGDDAAFEVEIPFTVVDKVEPLPCPALDELAFAKARTDRTVKVTIPSPGLVTVFWGEASKAAYPSCLELAQDMGDAVMTWARELSEAGCEYVSLDLPDLNDLYCDPTLAKRMYDDRGIPSVEMRDWLTDWVVQFGELELAGTIKAMHLCRGNGTQSWLAEGGYEDFASHVLTRATGFDVYHFEYDDERSGDFGPLAKMPEGKVASLGLVSTKWTRMETAEELKTRLQDAARFHPLELLSLSPQCGFAGAAETAEKRKITDEVQREKLQLIVDVARDVWGDSDR